MFTGTCTVAKRLVSRSLDGGDLGDVVERSAGPQKSRPTRRDSNERNAATMSRTGRQVILPTVRPSGCWTGAEGQSRRVRFGRG